MCVGFMVPRVRHRDLDFIDIYCYASAITSLVADVDVVVEYFRQKAKDFYLEHVASKVGRELQRRWRTAVEALALFLALVPLTQGPQNVDEWQLPYTNCAVCGVGGRAAGRRDSKSGTDLRAQAACPGVRDR